MPNSVIDFLRTRKSAPMPLIGSPGPSEPDLQTILEVGCRVPDHEALAPWRFILYRGAGAAKAGEVLAQIQEARNGPLNAAQRERELSRFSRCPLGIGVVSSPTESLKAPEWEQFLSAGAVALNLVHAATALGYAANWVTGWYAGDAEAAAGLGARAGERFVGFVFIGTPRGDIPERVRPDWRAHTREFGAD